MQDRWKRGRATALGVLGFSCFVGVAIAVAAACATLPAIPSGTCGNHIVESGEDCDGFANGGTCGDPADKANACRFTCSPSDAGLTTACPSGFVCDATKSVCQQPSLSFSALGNPVPSAADLLRSGDIDGDGLVDVVAKSPGDLTVHFGTPAGLDAPFTIHGQVSVPSVGKLHPPRGGIDTSDLTFADERGAVQIWLGQRDRSLVPASYPRGGSPLGLFLLAGKGVRGDGGVAPISVHALGQGGPNGGNPERWGIVPFDVGGTGEGTPVYVGALGHVVATAVGDLFEQTSCDDFAVLHIANGPNGAASALVEVVSPCVGDRNLGDAGADKCPFAPDAGPANDLGNFCSAPPVPFGAEVGPAAEAGAAFLLVRDADGDGHQDLILTARLHLKVGAEDHNWESLVALGHGRGAFDTPKPLVNDRVLDISSNLEVLPGGVSIRSGSTPFEPITSVSPGPTSSGWSDARIVDLNGDGLPDIVAAAVGTVDVFLGSPDPRAFAHRVYALRGLPEAVDSDPLLFLTLRTGDLDGDGVTDVVVEERRTTGGTDDLYLLFGAHGNYPSEPAFTVGLTDVVPNEVHVTRSPDDKDSIDDLALVRRPDGGASQVYVFNGSATRVLTSPLLFFGLSHGGGIRGGDLYESAAACAVGPFDAGSVGCVALDHTLTDAGVVVASFAAGPEDPRPIDPRAAAVPCAGGMADAACNEFDVNWNKASVAPVSFGAEGEGMVVLAPPKQKDLAFYEIRPGDIQIPLGTAGGGVAPAADGAASPTVIEAPLPETVRTKVAAVAAERAAENYEFSLVVADFDQAFTHDGRDDVIAMTPSLGGGRRLKVGWGTGAGVVADGGLGANFALSIPDIPTAVPTAIASADLDGDGVPELLVAAAVAFGNEKHPLGIFRYRATGANTFGPPELLPHTLDAGLIHALTAGDFDGDGLVDLAVITVANGTSASAAGGQTLQVFRNLPQAAGTRRAPLTPGVRGVPGEPGAAE